MQSKALETARARYTAAYEAYQRASRRVAEKLKNGLVPSANEIAQEATATEALGAARRTLIDAIATEAPGH
jgi:F0F1-type ATP synthase membrane subunit b/b'